MPIIQHRRLPVFSGKEEDVLSRLRYDFDNNAFPFFDGIERERVGSSKDGEYIHHVESNMGLAYTGVLNLIGYSCKWHFSTIFKYISPDGDISWICYAIFFQNCIAVFISHSMRRFNERALNNVEPSNNNVFFKHILPQMEYSQFGIDSHGRNALFMRVDEGAFLSYTFLNDGNYWFRTFVSNNLMFRNQSNLSSALDEIRNFEMDMRIRIMTIFQPVNKERIESWYKDSEENRLRYISLLDAIYYVLHTADEGIMLDEGDAEFLSIVNKERDSLKS